MKKKLRITLLMDNPRSWFQGCAEKLAKEFERRGHTVTRAAKPEKIPEGDCAFFFSVEGIVSKKYLERHAHNIVIHASALPKGKGWSPLTWQILEGKNQITMTLFEAAERVDSGPVYDREDVSFDGTELIDELREKMATGIRALALRFIDQYPPPKGQEQKGEEIFYPRRKPEDSELDPSRPLIELFNQLRVADNERYPAFFKHKGKTYIIKIYKKE